jgi:hypothetical protein
MEWIKGRELLEPPYNLTRREISQAVQEGMLVPYESSDAHWTSGHGFLDIDERLWRVFPTCELQKEWLQTKAKLSDLENTLTNARKMSQKTDEEIVEQERSYRLEFLLQQSSEEIESKQKDYLINKIIPKLRQKWAQEINELPLKIKDLENTLENEYAPNRAWILLNFGPTQEETLLDCFYEKDDVESLLKAQSRVKGIVIQNTKKA